MRRKVRFFIKNWLVIILALLYADTSMRIFPASIPDSNSKGEPPKSKLFKKLLEKGINKDKLKGDLIILLFFDSLKTTHKAILDYANTLQCKYQSGGLQIIGISVRNDESASNLKKYGDYSLRIISDSNKDIHSEFGFQECCGGTVFLDKKRKTIFLEKRLIDAEVLRQLTEKYLLGKVNYTFNIPKERIRFKPNTGFPSLTFRKEGESAKIVSGDLIKNLTVLTFFSSMCSTCKTGRRVGTLTKIKEIFDDRKVDANFYLVFFPPFDENDIQFWEQDIKLPFKKVFCFSKVYSDEEKYISDNSMRLDPLTVIVDTTLDVIFLEQFGMSEEELIENIKRLKVLSK
jgi:peroxiredoxin